MPLEFADQRKNGLERISPRALKTAFEAGQSLMEFQAVQMPQDVELALQFLAGHDAWIILHIDSSRLVDLDELEAYIDDNYELQLGDSRMLESINFNHHESMQVPMEKQAAVNKDKEGSSRYLQPSIKGGQGKKGDCRSILQSGRSFSATIAALMQARGVSFWQLYKRANLDQKHLEDILASERKLPDKNLLLALGIALQLQVEELGMLLENYGCSLSSSSIADLIVRFFAEQKEYDISTINLALFRHCAGQIIG